MSERAIVRDGDQLQLGRDLRTFEERAVDGEVRAAAEIERQPLEGEGLLAMRFALLEEDGLPPIDTHCSMIPPSAFAGASSGVPLVRNHEWREVIGSGQVEIADGAAWVRGRFHPTPEGQAARATMLDLLADDVVLEASVSMNSATAEVRRGGDLTDEERDKFVQAGVPAEWGYVIDRAEIVEVSWVLSGSVPATEVIARGEPDVAAGDKVTARNRLMLATSVSEIDEVLR